MGRSEIFEPSMPSDRKFCELSENHISIVIGPTKQKLWPVENLTILADTDLLKYCDDVKDVA